LDVLHIQAPYSPFMSGRLMREASPHTAIVCTFHILPYGRAARYGSRLLGWWTRSTSRRFDACLAVSEPAATFAQDYYGLSCKVIPNAFDYRHFYRKSISDSVAQNLRDPVRVVFLGRLVPRKGCKELLEAITYLIDHHLYDRTFSVTIGGKGPYRSELERYVADHGETASVRFVGFLADKDKADFLSQADIAVFPSVGGESFGISLLEALAAARGVVLAGDNPGYRSVMRGFESQLFDPRNTQQFAQTLAHFMREHSTRRTIAAAQKAYVAQYDINRVGQEIEMVYKKAVEKRKTA